MFNSSARNRDQIERRVVHDIYCLTHSIEQEILLRMRRFRIEPHIRFMKREAWFLEQVRGYLCNCSQSLRELASIADISRAAEEFLSEWQVTVAELDAVTATKIENQTFVPGKFDTLLSAYESGCYAVTQLIENYPDFYKKHRLQRPQSADFMWDKYEKYSAQVKANVNILTTDRPAQLPQHG